MIVIICLHAYKGIPVAALHRKELVQILFSSYEGSVILRLVCNMVIKPHENRVIVEEQITFSLTHSFISELFFHYVFDNFIFMSAVGCENEGWVLSN